MSTIPASLYVNVNPDVLSAGGAGLDLIGLFLTNGPRVPIGAVQPFGSALAVQNYFGAGSNEAIDAAIYFAGSNAPGSVIPGQLLFAQYPLANVPAFVRGGNISALTLAQLQALSGTLSVTIDGVLKTGSVNFAAATSFSNAAQIAGNTLGIKGVQDGSVTGSITTTVLTVTAVLSGQVGISDVLTGTGVTAGTYITAQLTGAPGGIGTYSVNVSQTASSTTITSFLPAVTYDSVSGAFGIASGTAGITSTITYGSGAMGTSMLLTQATGAVLSQGAAAAVPGPFMDSIVSLTQNWATFRLGFNPDNSGNANKLLFAAWTSAQNNRYAYMAKDFDVSPTTVVPATTSLGYLIGLSAYSGTGLVWEPSGLKTDVLECAIAASIDFTRRNGRTTFAFQSSPAGITPGVTDQQTALNLTANGYNYFGAVATANQGFNFLYPGSVSGKFKWMDTYLNQIQLNSQLQLALMTLVTSVGSIPYNTDGYTMIETALQDPINAALNFGTIRTNVPLSALQAAEVNAQAGTSISRTLSTQGWYLQILPADANTRALRKSPPAKLWYMDGESVQQIVLGSVVVQ